MLSVSQLSKNFGVQAAVKSVSFSVKSGEILAIVGESGSGKTTLLNMISGTITPDNGSINLNGIAIDLYFERLIAELPDIKLVAQDYRLKPQHKVHENIDLALTGFSASFRQKRVAYLMKMLGIENLKDSKPAQISGGEKQRTAIAKALANPPKVLLLDEPFSNLDTINKQKLKTSIPLIIKQEGIACVFVTHDLLDALLVADKIGIMKKGKILLLKKPVDLLKGKNSQYVADFLSSAMQPFDEFRARFGS